MTRSRIQMPYAQAGQVERAEAAQDVLTFLRDLHAKQWPQPHQAECAKLLFVDMCSDIWIEGGRKGGKSYGVIAYCAWRWAGTFPGSCIYYYAPEQKQAREILWSPGIIQNFGPSQYLAGPPNNTEMRLRFRNGSMIKLDGSDNFESVRGISEAHLFFLDERRNFKSQFFQAFDPNRARYRAPVVSTSTPPESEGPYTQDLTAHLNGMSIEQDGELDRLKTMGGNYLR